MGYLYAAIYSVLGTGFIGGIGWAFKANSRVSVLEQQHIDLKELIKEQFKTVTAALERIDKALNIEQRRD